MGCGVGEARGDGKGLGVEGSCRCWTWGVGG